MKIAPNAEIDTVLDTLRHSWRRTVIQYFETETDTYQVSLDTLVSYLHEVAPELPRDGIEVALVHTHLPKLEAQGWLRYQRATREVEYQGLDPIAPGVLATLGVVPGDRHVGTPTS